MSVSYFIAINILLQHPITISHKSLIRMSQPPPQLSPSHLCSVSVTLGPSLPPIPLLGGGTRILQPITGGSIQGAGFNGTIDGGLSAPIHLDARSESGETQITKLPWIYVYGHADDGSPFFIEEAGIGSVGKQNTRVVIQVGGVYARLQEAFLVGQPGREPGGKGARVECWVVPLEGGYCS